MISSLFDYFFGVYFDWCYDCNNTPSHLHCFHFPGSLDIPVTCGDCGEVGDIWWHSQPNWLLLVSKTLFSGPGWFYHVSIITAYPFIWSFFMGGVICYPLHNVFICLCCSFLLWMAYFLNVGYFWLPWCEVVKNPPHLPPMTITLIFSWCCIFWVLSHWIIWCRWNSKILIKISSCATSSVWFW